MKPMMIEKIPLKDFISILIELYDKGANYIDLGAGNRESQDTIKIIVKDTYVEIDQQETEEQNFNDLII